MLLECLKWDSFDEDKDMQRSIHLDFLYDNLMFAVNKGFSWDKVVTVFDFGSELLSEIKGNSVVYTFDYCLSFKFIRPVFIDIQ